VATWETLIRGKGARRTGQADGGDTDPRPIYRTACGPHILLPVRIV
jgi:hypothetical protein